jgi:RNA-dependent RNA polymerase
MNARSIGPLHLNRQDILLLSTRDIPDAFFLVLQNENHLELVQALLCSSNAFELLHNRIGSMYFNFRAIFNATHPSDEPFFFQLLITCGYDCLIKLQQRAKIKLDKNTARNMFGTIDEYGVLEYGQVFIQYNQLTDDTLNMTDRLVNVSSTILDNVQVVITKNPCHHPGDLRTFTAVNRPELKHLVDVVVFPQKGDRPHSHEISGGDLDGMQ